MRRAAGDRVSLVELVDAPIDFRLDRRVAAELRARRHADLDERQPAAQIGPPTEHLVERGKSFRDPFRVIESVHTDSDELGTKLEQALRAAAARGCSAGSAAIA